MSAWSRERPTEVGWYWAVHAPGRAPIIRQIFLNHGGELCVFSVVGAARLNIIGFDQTLWQKVKPFDE